jgi:NitT/TauT family transport system substrate-binding protein
MVPVTHRRCGLTYGEMVTLSSDAPPPTPHGRRRFLAAAAAAASAPWLVPRPARAQPTVKIGTAILGDYGLAAPVMVALERAYFRHEGLNVDYVPFKGGPDLVKAVSAGTVLVGVSGGTDLLVFRERGAPIQLLATQVESNHFTLNVAPGIQSLAELRGQAIGVTAPGSTTWVFARMIARHQGWDPDRDVKIVALGDLEAQVAALARKETAAFVFGDAGVVTQQQGKSRILLRLDEVTPKWISAIQYASEEQVRKNGDAVRKVMRALFRATRFMRDDAQAVAVIAGKRLGWSPEAVLGAHKITGGLLSHDGTISMEALKTMQDALLEHGVLARRLPLEEHVAKGFTPVRLS